MWSEQVAARLTVTSAIDYVGSVANAVTLLSRLHRGERRLVFADSRARVEELATGLRSAGVRTFASHGSLSADERRQAEAAFGTEPDCAIVATSTLELGIDVGDLDRVVQVGAPPSVASFVQRMGRTGRRVNTTRNCLFLAIDDYDLLLSLGICGLWHEGRVEHIVPAPRPLHLFAQQVMALVLQEAGIARCDLDAWLGPTFDVLAPGDRETVLAYMLSTGMLNSDNGVLGLGPRASLRLGEGILGTSSLVLAVRCYCPSCMDAASSGPCILWRWRRRRKTSRSSFFLPAAVGGLWTLIGRDGAYRLCQPREAAGRVGLAEGGRPHSPCVGLPKPWSLAGGQAAIYLTEPRQGSKRSRSACPLSTARASQSFRMGTAQFACGPSPGASRMRLLAKRFTGLVAARTTSVSRCAPPNPLGWRRAGRAQRCR